MAGGNPKFSKREFDLTCRVMDLEKEIIDLKKTCNKKSAACEPPRKVKKYLWLFQLDAVVFEVTNFGITANRYETPEEANREVLRTWPKAQVKILRMIPESGESSEVSVADKIPEIRNFLNSNCRELSDFFIKFSPKEIAEFIRYFRYLGSDYREFLSAYSKRYPSAWTQVVYHAISIGARDNIERIESR